MSARPCTRPVRPGSELNSRSRAAAGAAAAPRRGSTRSPWRTRTGPDRCSRGGQYDVLRIAAVGATRLDTHRDLDDQVVACRGGVRHGAILADRKPGHDVGVYRLVAAILAVRARDLQATPGGVNTLRWKGYGRQVRRAGRDTHRLASRVSERLAQHGGGGVVPPAVLAADRPPPALVLDFDPAFIRSQATLQPNRAVEELPCAVLQRPARKQPATDASVPTVDLVQLVPECRAVTCRPHRWVILDCYSNLDKVVCAATVGGRNAQSSQIFSVHLPWTSWQILYGTNGVR